MSVYQKSNTSERKWSTPERKCPKPNIYRWENGRPGKKWITQSHPGCEWQSQGQNLQSPSIHQGQVHPTACSKHPDHPGYGAPSTWHIGSIQINLWWSFVPRWFQKLFLSSLRITDCASWLFHWIGKKKMKWYFPSWWTPSTRKYPTFLKKKKKMPALKWNQDGIEEWETQF